MWTAAHPLAGRAGPDHLLLLGDNAYPKGTDADYQIALFDTHGALLRRMPVWPAIGNHDVDSPGYAEDAQAGAYFDIFTLPARGEAGGVASERESYYSFDLANIHFVVLNSSHPPYLASPESGNPMLAWLERDLAATDQEWVIAYWHFPPYGKATYDSDVNNGLRRPRENYLPMLDGRKWTWSWAATTTTTRGRTRCTGPMAWPRRTRPTSSTGAMGARADRAPTRGP